MTNWQLIATLVTLVAGTWGATWINTTLLKHYIDAKFEGLDCRFQALDARFQAIDVRFQAIEARLDKIDRQLEQLFKPAGRA